MAVLFSSPLLSPTPPFLSCPFLPFASPSQWLSSLLCAVSCFPCIFFSSCFFFMVAAEMVARAPVVLLLPSQARLSLVHVAATGWACLSFTLCTIEQSMMRWCPSPVLHPAEGTSAKQKPTKKRRRARLSGRWSANQVVKKRDGRYRDGERVSRREKPGGGGRASNTRCMFVTTLLDAERKGKMAESKTGEW